MQLDAVARMLQPQGIHLEATPQAIDYLAAVGYDPEFGARPVKRALQHEVLNVLSRKLLSGDVNTQQPIIIDYFDEQQGLVFKN